MTPDREQVISDEQSAADREPYKKDYNCSVCGKKVTVMIFMDQDICSEICRKKRDGEQYEEPALTP